MYFVVGVVVVVGVVDVVVRREEEGKSSFLISLYQSKIYEKMSSENHPKII